MEYLDEVNENNEITGKKYLKDEFHNRGLWYREIIGIVMNQNNEILLQKRSPNKKDKPNLWEICFGHVSSGETPEKSIIRELKEEINLSLDEGDLIHLGIEYTDEYYKETRRFHKAFSYIYLIKTNKTINEFKLQDEEVCDIKYISINELIDKLKAKDSTLAFVDFDFILKALEKISVK